MPKLVDGTRIEYVPLEQQARAVLDNLDAFVDATSAR
jgi:hypothetical protein